MVHGCVDWKQICNIFSLILTLDHQPYPYIAANVTCCINKLSGSCKKWTSRQRTVCIIPQDTQFNLRFTICLNNRLEVHLFAQVRRLTIRAGEEYQG